MDGIRPWISAFISKALSNCIDNPKEGTHGPSRRDWISRAGDDGSNFRIAVRTSQAIQLVQWLGAELPVKATLSDSVTLIDAIFSGKAIERYQITYKKNVRNETKGAFLKVTSFEIVVSHSTRAHPPSLYVEEFEIAGCEGTGIFGNPIDIGKDRGIVQLVQKIRNKCNYGEHDEQDPDDSDKDSDAGPMRSQEEADEIPHEDLNGDHPASQEVVSTQIPHPQPRPTSVRRSLPQARKLEGERLIRNLSSNDHPVGVRTQARGSRRPESLSPSKRGSSTVLSPKDTFSRKEASGQSHRGHLTPRRSPALNTDGNMPQRVNSSSDKSSRQSLPSLSSRVDKNSSTERGKTNGQLETGAGKAPHSASDRDAFSAKVQAEEMLSASEHPDNLSSSVHHVNRKCSKTFTDTSEDRDPWKSWTRIRRRDVIIPKDQEDLFANSRSDAWVPPEPGKPMPHAQVPVSLLGEWNDIHTRQIHAREPTRSQPEGVSTDQEHETSSTGDSLLPTSPLDEEEWPASEGEPEKNLVPADSSPPRRSSRSKSRSPNKEPNLSAPHKRIQRSNLVNSESRDGTDISRETASSEMPLQSSLGKTAEDDHDRSAMEGSVPRGSGIVVSQEADISLANISSDYVSSFPSTQGGRGDLPVVSENADSNGVSDAQPLANNDVEGSGDEDVLGSSHSQTEVLVPATAQCGDTHTHPQPCDPARRNSQISANTEQANSGLDAAGSSNQMGPDHSSKDGERSSKEPDSSRRGVNTNNSDDQQPQSKAGSPLKKRRRVDSDASLPLKRQKSSETTPVGESDTIAPFPVQKKSLDVDNREAYFHGELAISPGRYIYNNFKQTYRQYDGDIAAFKKSCRSLQSLYDQGDLKRSVLWDDFVGRERTDYHNYLVECLHQKGTPETYETWFLHNITLPRFKKRNLTIKKIAAVVDDSEITIDEDSSQNEKEHSPKSHCPPESDPQHTPKPSPEVRVQHDTRLVDEDTRNTPDQIEETAKGDTNHEGEDSDTRSQGSDENHDEASIILDDPEPAQNARRNNEDDEENGISAVNDLDMDDVDSVPSDIEGSFISTGAAKQEAVNREDMTEIEESDHETPAIRGRSVGVTEPSHKRDQSETTATGNARAAREKSTSRHRGRGRFINSPVVEGSVYPPYPSPQRGRKRATATDDVHTARESASRNKRQGRAGSPPADNSRHLLYPPPKRSKEQTTTTGDVHVAREQSTSRNKGHRGPSFPAVEEHLYPPYQPPSRPATERAASRQSHTRPTPWYKEPNTPFKTFAPAYAGLRSQLDRFRRSQDASYPPVNEEGVSKDPSEGRMSSMGWSF